jgi:Bacterial regulatory proteins, lacI family/Periplasmic binding proteins and sugar binding domain of LacI family
MAADKPERTGRTGSRRSVTIRDVAQAAGVHPSTVSRSLDPGQAARVNEATRERVLAAARALEYEPDMVARSLRNQRTHTVGIVVPDLGNPLYAGMIRGLNDALERRGYAWLMHETVDDGGRLDRTLSLFARRRVDAVIVASAREHDRAVLRQFARQGVPLVLAVRWIRGINLPTGGAGHWPPGTCSTSPTGAWPSSTALATSRRSPSAASGSTTQWPGPAWTRRSGRATSPPWSRAAG